MDIITDFVYNINMLKIGQWHLLMVKIIPIEPPLC